MRAGGVEFYVTVLVEGVVAIECMAVALIAAPFSLGIVLLLVPLDDVWGSVGVGGLPFRLRCGRKDEHCAKRGEQSINRTHFSSVHRAPSSHGVARKLIVTCCYAH